MEKFVSCIFFLSSSVISLLASFVAISGLWWMPTVNEKKKRRKKKVRNVMSGKGGGRLDQRNQKMMTAIYHWPCWIVFLLLLFAPALTHTTTHLKLHFRMNSCLSSYSPPLLPLCIIRVFSRYMMILIIILYNQSRLLVFFFYCVLSPFDSLFLCPSPFLLHKKNNSVRILLDIFFTCVYGRVSGAFHVRKHYIKRLKTTKNRCVFFSFLFDILLPFCLLPDANM